MLIVARKNGKTSMLGAYALYELVYGEGRPEILLAAASDRQAGRLSDAASRFVRRHPGLSERLRVRDHEGVIVREDRPARGHRVRRRHRLRHGNDVPSLPNLLEG